MRKARLFVVLALWIAATPPDMIEANTTPADLVGRAIPASTPGMASFNAILAGDPDSVVCGWCHEQNHPTYGWRHTFNDEEGDWCEEPNPFEHWGFGEIDCSRCGGSSECHTQGNWNEPEDITEGPCHITCWESFVVLDQPGISGSKTPITVAALVTRLERSLKQQDAGDIVALIRNAGDGAVRYSDAGRRLIVVAPCDPTVIVDQYPVTDDMRRSLQALRANSN